MKKIHVAIACGGTGGHLFPGLAVAEALKARAADVSLLISPKQVDQEAVKAAEGMEVITLPAVALSGRRWLRFLSAFAKSLAATKRHFRRQPPQAVLAMGGFTSAPPILAGRSFGAVRFLHESNTIPGRANRWLTRVADQVFVGFPEAAGRLRHGDVVLTGTPVRESFRRVERAGCCRALGLGEGPLLVVIGGSQGAGGINELMVKAVPKLVAAVPGLQVLHLTGLGHMEKVRSSYGAAGAGVKTIAFLREMERALGAATVVVSRAGASSLAELAAARVPSILVPYPHAVENHQYQNARAFADSGAALLMEERSATTDQLVQMLVRLLEDRMVHRSMQEALAGWDAPRAADLIAEKMLQQVEAKGLRDKGVPERGGGGSSEVESRQSVAA